MSESAIQQACQEIDTEAERLVTEILALWARIAADELWLALPPSLSHDHLPDLLNALAQAALCSLEEEAARSRLVELGARHGADRRSEGFSEELIFREYHLLRTFLWQWIRERWGNLGDAHEAILLLDAAITLSTSASLRGYHRTTLERQQRWPRALDDLVREYWPVLER